MRWGASMQVEQSAEHAPRSSLRSSLPPKFGGRPRDVFGTQVRVGCSCVTHRIFRSARMRNANAGSEREGNPQTWGRDAYRWKQERGHPTRSAKSRNHAPHAKLTARSIAPQAGHRPSTRRQVCPPPEHVVRDSGGPRTNESEGRGGCEARGGCVHHHNTIKTYRPLV